MATVESRSGDRKKVCFPTPKAWDPEAKWTQKCVMFQDCGEKHSPARCDIFKKLSAQQRLGKIDAVSCAGCATVICRGESVGPGAGYLTAVLAVARHLTIPYCTACSWRAVSWS
jgi:hypothetical protein